VHRHQRTFLVSFYPFHLRCSSRKTEADFVFSFFSFSLLTLSSSPSSSLGYTHLHPSPLLSTPRRRSMLLLNRPTSSSAETVPRTVVSTALLSPVLRRWVASVDRFVTLLYLHPLQLLTLSSPAVRDLVLRRGLHLVLRVVGLHLSCLRPACILLLLLLYLDNPQPSLSPRNASRMAHVSSSSTGFCRFFLLLFLHFCT
jgi:hypothetical protein